jgi:hypothetical protein
MWVDTGSEDADGLSALTPTQSHGIYRSDDGTSGASVADADSQHGDPEETPDDAWLSGTSRASPRREDIDSIAAAHPTLREEMDAFIGWATTHPGLDRRLAFDLGRAAAVGSTERGSFDTGREPVTDDDFPSLTSASDTTSSSGDRS